MRSPAAIAFFYSFYRNPQRVSITACHAQTVGEARKHGWAWAGSYQATLAWLRRHDDEAATCRLRKGDRRSEVASKR